MKLKTLCMALALFGAPMMARADLRIVTTASDYADIARQIGGEHVDRKSVV